MKRAGNLIEKIADLDNLRYAQYLAMRGKYKKKSVQEWFFKDMEDDLQRISKNFLNKNVVIPQYHNFKVFEPKERMIYASDFESRVVQHALMNVCKDVFDRFQISDSYACQIGKGQYKALEKAKKFHRKSKYFVKLDVKKYFDSVNHDVLKTLLRKKFKDEYVLNAFDRIIDSYNCQKNQDLQDFGIIRINAEKQSCQSFNLENPDSDSDNKHGIPIGNLTSQYFANYYLGVADHFIKENLQIKYYVRYMDDMVIWGNDKTELKRTVAHIRAFLHSELHLELKEIVLNSTAMGLPFLGYSIMKNCLRLTRSCKQRFERKLALYRFFYNHNLWNRKDYFARAEPLTAFLLKADTLGLRQKINKKYPLTAS